MAPIQRPSRGIYHETLAQGPELRRVQGRDSLRSRDKSGRSSHTAFCCWPLLVEKLGADVTVRSDRNETALHRAACRAVDSVVQYPADKGAILDMSHACRMTPLDIWWMVYRSPLILGRSLEKTGYSDHTAAFLKKSMADGRYSKRAALS
jgi:hypothetical protein